MAVAETIGHDKRGMPIYKRNPDGSLILRTVGVQQEKVVKGSKVTETVESSEPITDDELGDVPALFRNWLKASISSKFTGKKAVA
jgi:type I restriction enzyme M protein